MEKPRNNYLGNVFVRWKMTFILRRIQNTSFARQKNSEGITLNKEMTKMEEIKLIESSYSRDKTCKTKPTWAVRNYM